MGPKEGAVGGSPGLAVSRAFGKVKMTVTLKKGGSSDLSGGER